MCSVALSCLTPWLHGLQPTRLICPWNVPGKNTIVGCHFLLQGIFQNQGANLHFLCLLHWQVDFFLLLSHLGSPQPIKSFCKQTIDSFFPMKENIAQLFTDILKLWWTSGLQPLLEEKQMGKKEALLLIVAIIQLWHYECLAIQSFNIFWRSKTMNNASYCLITKDNKYPSHRQFLSLSQLGCHSLLMNKLAGVID